MQKILRISCLALMLAAAAAFAAVQVRADALHGLCNSPTAPCSDNGTVTPVASSTPTYGFTGSSGGEVGDFQIVTLIPNNVTGAGSESFSVMGGATSPAAASLVSSTPWTSGKLDAYLGISASPANPIGAFLSTTQGFQSSATGYFVYVADLGTNTLLGASATSATPSLNDGSFLFPNGAAIVAFINTGTSSSPNWIATANSGQLSIDGSHTVTPEPASLVLFGTGLLGFAFVIRRKFAHAA